MMHPVFRSCAAALLLLVVAPTSAFNIPYNEPPSIFCDQCRNAQQHPEDFRNALHNALFGEHRFLNSNAGDVSFLPDHGWWYTLMGADGSSVTILVDLYVVDTDGERLWSGWITQSDPPYLWRDPTPGLRLDMTFIFPNGDQRDFNMIPWVHRNGDLPVGDGGNSGSSGDGDDEPVDDGTDDNYPEQGLHWFHCATDNSQMEYYANSHQEALRIMEDLRELGWECRWQ